MAKILFLSLVALTILHFFYSNVVLPAILHILRSELFEIRDRLRNLKLQEPEKLNDRAFDYLQDFINNIIYFLPSLTFGAMWRANQAFEDDSDLRDQIEKRLEITSNSELAEVEKIKDHSVWLFTMAVVANSGMWFLYLSPFIALVPLVLFVHRRISEIKTQFAITARDLAAVPPQDIEKVKPRLAAV